MSRLAAIHVLEHFYEWDALPLLQEWKRVLRPGGHLILELPCMDKVLKYITRCVNDEQPISMSFSWFAFWGDPQHRSVAMTHKWGYTEHSVLDVVTRAGFVQATIQCPRYHFLDRDMRVVAYKGVV